MKSILKPLASLRLTVVLILLSIALVYAGTGAQADLPAQVVQKNYFHSVVAWVRFQDLLLPFHRGGFPFPGGYTLGALLLTNLLAAHTVRFKISWKRLGIILIHAGLVMLLVGEFFTSKFAVESQMSLRDGESRNYTEDIRHIELAIVDTSPSDHDQVTVVPDSRFARKNAVVRDQRLPFEISVTDFFPNSDVANLRPGEKSLATAGRGSAFKIINLPRHNGTEATVDVASAYVHLSARGKDLGTYLVSQTLNPDTINVDGKIYQISLRFRRYYKPYVITLKKFVHSVYTGTDIPKDFASIIRLYDPTRNEDREVRIWMNHPLRYEGETFYQSSVQQEKDAQGHKFDVGTVLQVVDNPSWLMPYVACVVTGFGLGLHFLIVLVGFLCKRMAAQAKEESALIEARAKAARNRGTEYTLEARPWWSQASTLVALGAAACLAIYLFSNWISVHDVPPTRSDEFNLEPVARLPISYNGRVKPLDTLAAVKLQLLSGRQTFRPDGKTVRPAILWLMDTMTVTGPQSATYDYKVIRIDDPDVKNFIGLDPEQHLFTMREVLKKPRELIEQIQRAHEVKDKDRDRYQGALVKLGAKLQAYQEVSRADELFLVPPAATSADWTTIDKALQQVQEGKRSDPAPKLVSDILSSYINGQTNEFNHAVSAYTAFLNDKFTSDMDRINWEVYFNRFDPFTNCIAFYICIFLAAAISWLCIAGSAPGTARTFRRVAFAMLLVTLVLHTLGLIGRVYISQRPPVTNLASAALFIAWGAAILAAGLELVFKNSIGSAAAAIVGGCSLFLSHKLSLGEDNMEVLQAVLDTNFWLATHVIAVTLGYAATFLAGVLGIVYVVRGVFTHAPTGNEPPSRPVLTDRGFRVDLKSLSKMTYGIVCFGILFSFVGTVLGGIWADQSWGRFWGWDPKENGAVLIVLWNALVLHARWGGLVKDRGVAVLTIGGNIVTSFSFFGTNLLGVGLHSYGFMEHGVAYLLSFMGSQLLFIAIGLLPLTMWRSFSGQAAARAK